MNTVNTIYEQEITPHLIPEIWEKVNRLHTRKILSELAHELIITPELQQTNNHWGHYKVIADTPEITYTFKAKKYALDHWHIDPKSITKYHHKEKQPLDSLKFIIEFRHTLGISDEMLPTYMEEITSTLFSAAFKYKKETFDAASLVHQDFQGIEHAMTEGHPCFIANNGRIGFNTKEFLAYSPEADHPFHIIWIAGHKENASFYCTKELSYQKVMAQQLGEETITRFNTTLIDKSLSPEAYIFIPVHPWQWNNKITTVFSQDIANQSIVYLGEGPYRHSAQQSIRSLYNLDHPKKFYTKTSLSILNMGFMRGLSPYYMGSTPPITEWISELLDTDSYLNKKGFTMLREVATVGYRNLYFEPLGKTKAHNKMLSALWRESPDTKIQEGEQLMTMAALLHQDNEGNSFLKEIIKASPINTESWVQQYLSAYLAPLIHCFYKYGIVFMPHGENLILVMKDHIPVRAIMKDITEEVIVFNDQLTLPEKVQRLYTETTDEMQILSIFTDVFDCIFRFITPILDEHCNYPETLFWKQVAICIHKYKQAHPELTPRFERYDIFVKQFKRCCLNRLQLDNTKQMLNLAAPIESLKLEGTLENPIAPFRKL
ncbi:IucA/IucC family siderophore biosynthesis protein [Aquimarina sp. TRL1]|uniref:IucA/IucC family protein n=1 Tax=Aquimarina sp. (strain TRL1) TaxID=2736252 RepID=UPI001C3774F8|nr:IucA/IucC family siderophore biosynthesis protein [Aquimarina sp. TRL1]